jgi:Ni,Fe-hydrogenase III small subunit
MLRAPQIWTLLADRVLNGLLRGRTYADPVDGLLHPSEQTTGAATDMMSDTHHGRSLFIRHLDCGSCNGCELELTALSNPVYDLERCGLRFEASPRHADLLALTGPVVDGLRQAGKLTLEAMVKPRAIVAVGDCAVAAFGGQPSEPCPFINSYAVEAPPMELRKAVIAHVPGCPPSPDAILRVLASLPNPEGFEQWKQAFQEELRPPDLTSVQRL